MKELQEGVKNLNKGKVKVMKFFCEDADQCKLEELLQCVMKFLDHLSTCAQVSGYRLLKHDELMIKVIM